MEPIEIKIYYSANLYDILNTVLSDVHIPFGGLVYAGIAKLLTEPEPLEQFPNPLNNDESTDFYTSRTVNISKYIYSKMSEKYGSDLTRAITHATTQMIRIGFGLPEHVDKWYRYSLQGYGSGKISKTK